MQCNTGMTLDNTRSQAISVLLHGSLLLMLLCLPSLRFEPLPPQVLPEAMPLIPRKLLWRAHDAGGSAQQQAPATAGRVEVHVTPRPLLPPVTRPLDHTPKLILDAGLHVDVPMPQTMLTGDPLSNVQGPPSGGARPGRGIGNYAGDAIGDGPGNTGLGSYADRWRGVTAPVVIYRVEPDYPDEARKAKFQGSVLVAVEVDEQGRVRGVRVVKPAGLGLDEKAIEAVKQWRFRPATRNGQPVPVPASIEVSFHLL